ncbi:MAG TPA: hypothetical protein VJX68_00875, partial [Candidatus Binatus sp.]|uniref:hypothetical protein n=1 Tax=Candidatus Binatus sp. TaxID=2811406 RepID=UPI002B47FB29
MRRVARRHFGGNIDRSNLFSGRAAVLNAIESRLRGYGLGKVSPECHSLCWNMLQPHDEGFPRIGISDSL